jgi:hypothetical protein
MYQPEIGKWNSPDPLAYEYFDHSPYNFVLNNPLKYVDPKGDSVQLIIGAPYTDAAGKEHPYGHVALRVYNSAEGYDNVYDFKHKGAKAFWALEGNPRFGDQGAAWEKNAYKQFSYKSEASPSMNKDEVYDYYKKNYNSDRMLGMTLHHESWFNTMILAPTSGTSAPAKKKKPDADSESSKRSGGVH